jgi:hypothetical protein
VDETGKRNRNRLLTNRKFLLNSTDMKTLFPKLFGPYRRSYRVVLKSGADFFLKAADVKIKWRNDTGEVTSYEFINPVGEVPFHVVPGDIRAILRLP